MRKLAPKFITGQVQHEALLWIKKRFLLDHYWWNYHNIVIFGSFSDINQHSILNNQLGEL